MKGLKRLAAAVMFVLAMSFCVASVRPVVAQAATKTVKNVKYNSYLTGTIKNKAVRVKRGTTKLKVTKQGFVKFTVPATKTYTFTFSGMTSVVNQHNNGFAYILEPTTYSYTSRVYLEHLKFKTTGGKTTTAWYHTKYLADTTKTTGSFLAKRSCKVKLQKGTTIYVYLSFATKGTVNLKIK